MAQTAGNPAGLPVRAMLDTNVLLAATDEGRAEHARALSVLNQWPAAGTSLYLSGQIAREYLAVATRPIAANGLGLAIEDALRNIRAVRSRAVLLPEDVRVADQLLGLLSDVTCSGKQVHDANIVATMVMHGVDTIVTINTSDFTRFSKYVTPRALS